MPLSDHLPSSSKYSDAAKLAETSLAHASRGTEECNPVPAIGDTQTPCGTVEGRLVEVRDEISLEHIKLRTDIDLVRQYGEAHPEAFVGLRYENEPTVRIVAMFAGGALEIHQEALRRLVSHPDQLEVRASGWPVVRLEEIRSEVHEMATSSEPGLFSGWGTGGGKVSVRLRADAEHVAAELQGRYGDAIDLTVGFLHFPECAVPQAAAPLLASLGQPEAVPLPEELHVVAIEVLKVKSGANLQSAIRLINEGDVEVVAQTNGRLTPRVVDPKSNETVGGYSGAQTMPLVRFRAPAGGSVEIPLLVGTASTVPRLGYAVPPGLWAVEITLGLGVPGVFQAPLIPLEVVA